MPSLLSQKKLTPVNPAGGQGLRILVAPLDWGLGHATRCIPLIQQLINNGAEVLLAGEEKISALLTEAFPRATLLPLKGYDIHYKGFSMAWSMIRQVPKILSAIKAERQWLRQTVQTHSINAVISDNRYGLYHPEIPSVIITHQLRIRSGIGAGADELLQRLHYRQLNKFFFCWVPDVENAPGLAGSLSHPKRLPATTTHFIGPQSRFAPQASLPKTIDYLFLLSGPEPQRTGFEELILAQLKNYSGNAVLVRGLPGFESHLTAPSPNITIHNHLPAEALANVIGAAKTVVCRSGYSTIMDLAVLGARSVLVPTPGQTEQEYLARHAQTQGWATAIAQNHFRLPLPDEASPTSPAFPQLSTPQPGLQPALEALFAACRQ